MPGTREGGDLAAAAQDDLGLPMSFL